MQNTLFYFNEFQFMIKMHEIKKIKTLKHNNIVKWQRALIIINR